MRPGHIIEENGKHYFRVKWRGLIYTDLPTGAHGKRDGRAEIQRGKVRNLVKVLGIVQCAQTEFEFLR